MKLNFTYRVTSMFLAVLVVFSTLSFTVKKHFCGTNLVDVAVFSDVKGCGMEAASMGKMKKPCCKEEVEIIKGLEDYKSNTIDDLSFQNHQVLSVYLFAYTASFKSLPKQIIPHKDYSPPNLIRDIQILDSVFLI